MFQVDLFPELHQVLLGDVLDLHQTLDNLKDGVIQQGVGQFGEQLVGDSHLVLSVGINGREYFING